ncbi:hypothetical protein TNCV_2142711 [Trichonephila clavipes]|nr:hypothetical protein TNCV_2142711 [Trichonephila clavipes]
MSSLNRGQTVMANFKVSDYIRNRDFEKAYKWLSKRSLGELGFLGYSANSRRLTLRTATAGSDVVQSGRPIFDDFFQHLWPYIGNNTANVVFQMAKRLWLIRIDQ